MFRSLPYIALFLVAVLSQVLFFDNLTVGILFSPLVYTLFLLLLPLETPQWLMLALGIVTGVVVDALTGSNGEHSIATIFIAYFRTPMLKILIGNERTSLKGVPSEMNFGYVDLIRYIVTMVLIHHFIFIAFDTLSLHNIHLTFVRFALSSAASVLYIWLLTRLFTNNNYLK